MNLNAITDLTRQTLERALVRALDYAPFVRPDRAEVIRRVAALTDHSVALQEPDDLFDPRIEPQVLDRVAWSYVRQAQRVAVGAGAATGSIGLPGAAIDLPILVGSTVGMIRRHALTYGFVNLEQGQMSRLPILLAFSASLGAEQAIGRLSAQFARAATGPLLERLLTRAISERLAAKLALAWLPRAVPLVSTVASATLDFLFLHEAGRRSMRYFRRRHDETRQEYQSGRPLALGAGLVPTPAPDNALANRRSVTGSGS